MMTWRDGQSTSQGETPQKKPAHLTPSSQTSCFKNCEKINFSCISHPVCSSLSWQPKQKNNYVPGNFSLASIRPTQQLRAEFARSKMLARNDNSRIIFSFYTFVRKNERTTETSALCHRPVWRMISMLESFRILQTKEHCLKLVQSYV